MRCQMQCRDWQSASFVDYATQMGTEICIYKELLPIYCMDCIIRISDNQKCNKYNLRNENRLLTRSLHVHVSSTSECALFCC
jgi:hypothetical protein